MNNGTKAPLTIWKDIDPLPRPLRKPPNDAKHVLIVGGGVTALVTAWVLLDHGYRVTLMSKSWASESERLTSQIAGALWEFPPAVCGKHSDVAPLHCFKNWSMIGYPIFQGLAADPELGESFGVKMSVSTFFFRSPIEEIPDEHEKMLEIMASGVSGFRRDAKIIQEQGIGIETGIVDAYQHLAPIIDTDKAIVKIMGLVRDKGAQFITETVEQDLLHAEESLLERFSAHLIVNATGLGSMILAGDETVFPIRGALLRFVNDGQCFPRISQALTAPSPDRNPNEFIFLVPRNDDVVVMGGVSQSHQWDLDLTLDSPSVVRMREMCESFMPALKNGKLVDGYPLAQGLRPFRLGDTRVERERRKAASRVIHSYAQGGSGWSWSFGCAEDVLKLVESIVGEPNDNKMDEMRCVAKPLILFGDAWE